MSKVKTFRASEKTQELLSELVDSGEFRSEGDVIQTAIKALYILEKLNEKDKKKFPLYSIFSMYRNSISIVELYRIVEQYSIVEPILYSTNSKKHEKKVEEPKKKNESYQQVSITEKVKRAMPYGDEFENAWISWRRYFKRRHGDHMTPDQELAQLKRITEHCTSEKEAVHSINYSITQNYAGIHFERNSKKAKPRTVFDRDKAEAVIRKKFRD